MIIYSVAVSPSSLGAAYTYGVSSLLPRCLREVWEREGHITAIGYFFSVTINLTKKLKINFLCFKKLNIN